MSADLTESQAATLRSDPEVKSRLRDFLHTDNVTNLWYIGRAWLVVVISLAAVIGFFESREALGLSFWWGVPIYLAALLAVGGSQHQLAGAGHEAVHKTLFKSRKLNEFLGDFLCLFPILTSVFQFRLYHLAHHQFVNDPERDPDFALLKDSGHWQTYPVSKASFLWMMVRQVFLVELVKYILVRVRYNTIGTHAGSPYRREGETSKKLPSRMTVGFFFFVILTSIVVQKWGEAWMLPTGHATGWGVLALILLRLPEKTFEKSRMKPVYHQRFMLMGLTGVFAAGVSILAFIQMSTGFMILRYVSLVWFVAMMTTFPFFLILRQVIQHGNGDRGWLTNTRVFRMNALVRYAVFPFGMDYHLPHHMYATIPHYRLRAFHDFMMTREEYRANCQIVDNYLVPDNRPPRNPTVVEVLGPDYSTASKEVHIDDTVLDDWEIDEKDLILRAGRAGNA